MPDPAAVTAPAPPPPPPPVLGLYGKLPAHGDFVRRALPRSFVAPWDDWLQAGIAAARETLGEAWEDAWRDGPAWRFALPPGACGPEAVAGVMVPSEDSVGRRFPLTLAAVFATAAAPPATPTAEAWFDALECLAQSGRAGEVDADGVLAALPSPLPGAAADAPVRDEVMAILSGEDLPPEENAAEPEPDAFPDRPAWGWWTQGGARLPAMVWEIATLPPPEEFAMLLDAPA